MNVLFELVVKCSKAWFSMCEFTFMDMKFGHYNDKVTHICYVRLFLMQVSIYESKQYIPPKQDKAFINTVSNKLTNINPETFDNGEVKCLLFSALMFLLIIRRRIDWIYIELF